MLKRSRRHQFSGFVFISSRARACVCVCVCLSVCLSPFAFHRLCFVIDRWHIIRLVLFTSHLLPSFIRSGHLLCSVLVLFVVVVVVVVVAAAGYRVSNGSSCPINEAAS